MTSKKGMEHSLGQIIALTQVTGKTVSKKDLESIMMEVRKQNMEFG